MTLIETERSTFVRVCPLQDLIPGRGVAALIDGRAVAVFRLDDQNTLAAIDNIDPFTGASVLSRGLIGHTLPTAEDPIGSIYIASPLRKQRIDLLSGRCLDSADRIATWAVRVVDGVVEVAREPSSSGNEAETAP